MLRPPDSPLRSSGCILLKNSSLELMSSMYLTETRSPFRSPGRCSCRCRAASWRSSGCPTACLRASPFPLPLPPPPSIPPPPPPQAASQRHGQRRHRQADQRGPSPSQSHCWPSPHLSSSFPARRRRVSVCLAARCPSGRLADQCMCSGSQLSATRAPPPGSDCRSASLGVGDEHGHPHLVAEVDDDLGRRPEIERALDDPLDPGRPLPGAVAVERSIRSFSGRTTAWQRSPDSKPSVSALRSGPGRAAPRRRRRPSPASGWRRR